MTLLINKLADNTIIVSDGVLVKQVFPLDLRYEYFNNRVQRIHRAERIDLVDIHSNKYYTEYYFALMANWLRL